MPDQFLSPSTSTAEYIDDFAHHNGYAGGTVPEARKLANICDFILTQSDGRNLRILCVIDLDVPRPRRFGATSRQLQRLGEACLRYTSGLGVMRRPVSIQVLEVGHSPITDADRARLGSLRPPRGLRSKTTGRVRLSAGKVDLASHNVWLNEPLHGELAALRHSLPRLAEARVTVARQERVVGPPTLPYFSWLLMLMLIGMYGVEQLAFWLQPSTGTDGVLSALGASSWTMTVQAGQWYRLVTSVLLHQNLFSMISFAFALNFAGVMLEPLIGRLWFGVLFILGGVAGRALGLFLYPPETLGLGAAGGMASLLGAALMCSFREPSHYVRHEIQLSLLKILLPALVPMVLTIWGSGHIVDYAAYCGGLATGLLAGTLLVMIWADDQPYPGLRGFAALLVAATVLVMCYAGFALAHQSFVQARLVPDNALIRPEFYRGTDGIAMLGNATMAQVEQYPADPRSHKARGDYLMRIGDRIGAEREYRLGLQQRDALELFLPAAAELELRLSLAILLAYEPGRQGEARIVAGPVCAAARNADLGGLSVDPRQTLSQLRLCG